MTPVLALATTLIAGSVSIKGSDTMLIMNQQLAEAFGQRSGSVAIDVSGGGSSIGINAFINGTCNVCASSREIRRSEIEKARSRGTVAFATPVALDGLCLAVNASNQVDSLSMDEIRKIYIGQITNWKQVGGADRAIVVISRDSNSGTYGFFQLNVLKNQNWGSGVRFLPSTSEEAREVSRTPGAIAYGGVAYFKGKSNVKVLGVSAKTGSPPVLPTEQNVRSKTYPIWRYLYYYTDGKPSGDVKKYIDFCLSAEGQRIVEKVGYYSLR